MKNIGIILVITAAAAMGAGAAEKLTSRCKVIRQIMRFIDKTAMMIRCTASPLEDIIAAAAADGRICALAFLKDINAALDSGETDIRRLWQDRLKAAPPTNIGGSELAVLEELGEILGSTDIEGQLNSLDIRRKLLQDISEEAERQKTEKGRLFRCLGVTAGLFIALILI